MRIETKNLKFLVRALNSRNFRLFFFGQAAALIGTWMQQIAMRWLVYRLTKSELMLGGVGFVSDIPPFLLVPFAGVLADRNARHSDDRRHCLPSRSGGFCHQTSIDTASRQFL